MGNHVVEIDVGQAVAVIGEKHLLAFEMTTYGPETFAYVAPYPRIDQRYAPISRQLFEQFHASGT